MRLRALVIGSIGLLALLALGGVGHAYDKYKWPSERCEQRCGRWPTPSCQNIEYCISTCNVASNLRQNCVAAEQQKRAVRERERSLEAKEASRGCNQRCRSWPNPTCQNLDFCISQCRSNPHDRQLCADYAKRHGTRR